MDLTASGELKDTLLGALRTATAPEFCSKSFMTHGARLYSFTALVSGIMLILVNHGRGSRLSGEMNSR